MPAEERPDAHNHNERAEHLRWLNSQHDDYREHLARSQNASIREEADYAVGSDAHTFQQVPLAEEGEERLAYRSLFVSLSLEAHSQHLAPGELDFSDEPVYRSLSLASLSAADEEPFSYSNHVQAEADQAWLAEARPPLVRRQRGFERGFDN